MSDLEHISTVIPKVFASAAQAAEDAELAAQIRAIPAPSRRPSETAMAYTASGGLAASECRPWPHGLRSRILQAIEAQDALALDDARQILEQLSTELGLLDEAYQSGSARGAYERWKNQQRREATP
jgi:hypothetical protein